MSMDMLQEISKSPDTECQDVLVVDGVPTTFSKVGPGVSFVLSVDQSDLLSVTTPEMAEVLESLGASQGQVMIGSLNEGFVGTAMGREPGLVHHVARAAEALARMFGRYGQWGSLAEFLSEVHYECPAGEPDADQPALTYWWLNGEYTGDGIVQPCGHVLGEGLLVRPGCGTLNIYTSNLACMLAAVRYGDELGMPLWPVEVPCLKCYLAGVTGDLGFSVIRRVVLDDRWTISLATCRHSETPSQARHQSIHDFDGTEYVLGGCSHIAGFSPVWRERAGKDRPDICGPRCRPVKRI